MEKGLIVAIDGYSSTGKSTIAKMLAKCLRYVYVDTGAMYRAVALYSLQHSITDEAVLKDLLPDISIKLRYNVHNREYETSLNGVNVENEIRGMDVSNRVSVVSSWQSVRTFLVEQQRKLGAKGGIVMDGRDIGTVVFPNADVKFFLTTKLEVRALRRYEQLVAKGVKVSYKEVAQNVLERDYKDENREISPLKPAKDAILIDNTWMALEDELDLMLREIRLVDDDYYRD
ncbi:MAG: (d)CMP kinase [Culturomica sp.]|jgi:cytidylate kinase|nr:(d)CMP kinase [Culturomica sp.]